MSSNKPTEILASLATLLPDLEAVYKDIHAHPELSMQETRTAGQRRRRVYRHPASWPGSVGGTCSALTPV